MTVELLDFDEIIVMRDGIVITTNVASGEETTHQGLED